MQSDVVLTAAHWIYLISVAAIILTMILRANVVVPSVIGTFLVVLAITGNPISALIGIFSASFVAAKELFNIFLVITFMTALLNALKTLQADVRMVQPFRRVMRGGHSSFVIIALCTYVISLFFWPTPAVPLVSAILLPAAIAAGLPPLAGAMAIAIAGQGMALSSDYVIGVAPSISAKAAGAAVSAAVVADRALVLSLITGGIALVAAYLLVRRQIVPADPALLSAWQARAQDGSLAKIEQAGSFDKAELARGTMGADPALPSGPVLSEEERRRVRWSKVFAVVTPLAFLAVIGVMVLPRLFPSLPALRGGDAAALVGGVAFVVMMLVTLAAEGPRKMLDVCPEHVTDGFVFAFKAMGLAPPDRRHLLRGPPRDGRPDPGRAAGAGPRPAVRSHFGGPAPDPREPLPGRLRRAPGRHDHRHRRLRLCRAAAHRHAVRRAGPGGGRGPRHVGGGGADGRGVDGRGHADCLVVVDRRGGVRAGQRAVAGSGAVAAGAACAVRFDHLRGADLALMFSARMGKGSREGAFLLPDRVGFPLIVAY